MFVIAPFYFTFYVYMLYIILSLFSCNFLLYYIIVFVFARVSVLVLFLFCILYVTSLALWLQDFNTYLLIYVCVMGFIYIRLLCIG